VPKSKSIKPWYRIAQNGKRVVLQYADSAVVLEGRAATVLLPKLLPLLDGHHKLYDVEGIAGEKVVRGSGCDRGARTEPSSRGRTDTGDRTRISPDRILSIRRGRQRRNAGRRVAAHRDWAMSSSMASGVATEILPVCARNRGIPELSH